MNGGESTTHNRSQAGIPIQLAVTSIDGGMGSGGPKMFPHTVGPPPIH